MSRPVLGHLDLVFVKMMEEIKVMLRAVFQLRNETTWCDVTFSGRLKC